jgi:hypothetical protein
VGFEELIQAVKECHTVAKTMETAGGGDSLPLVMHKLRDFMRLNGGVARTPGCQIGHTDSYGCLQLNLVFTAK